MAKVWIKTRLQNLAMKKKEAYVTRALTLPQLDEKDLIEAASRNSGLDRGTLYAAMSAINKEFQNFVLLGHSVKVPMVGCFRFRINATAADTEAEAGAQTVYRRKIFYLADKELWRKCQQVSLEQEPEEDTDDEGGDTPEP